MDKTQALEKLRSIGQPELLHGFDALSPPQQDAFLAQIEALNLRMLSVQQQMLLKQKQPLLKSLEPFLDFDTNGNKEDIEKGKRLIAAGKAGCILIAGGQGTRLRFEGPKGIYPVSVIRKKSLFQLFAEKTIAAGKQAGHQLPLAIMTSQQNHSQTLSFFERNALFGLSPSQIIFFTQGMLPLLDNEGKLFLDQPGQIAMGPDGNGSALKRFFENKIWDIWQRAGVRYANFVLIDNPLADPFDAELIGYHDWKGGDVILKCTERLSPQEKVGVLVKHEGHVKVIEYSEFPEEEKTALIGGKLKHRCANLSLFSFAMDFVKTAASVELPLHLAHKAVLPSKEPNAWKFEEFIFDLLPHALKARALLYPREQCFAPLKNLNGEGSIQEVQRALQEKDRQVIREITGLEPPQRPFELSQEFHYPTPALLEKWKGKPFPNQDYITP